MLKKVRKFVFTAFLSATLLFSLGHVFAADESFNLEKDKHFRTIFNLPSDEAFIKQVNSNKAYSESKNTYGVALTDKEFRELNKRQEVIEHAKKIKNTIIEDKFSKDFGGMYYDHLKNKLRIALVNNEEESIAAKEISDNFAYKDRLEFFIVTQSAQELSDLQAKITDFLNQKDVHFYNYTNVKDNRVVVGLDTNAGYLENQLYSLFGRSYITVKVEEVNITNQARTDYTRPLEGGLYLTDSSVHCSGGFSAYDDQFFYYFVTAGHCFSLSSNVSQGGSVIGSVAYRHYGSGGYTDSEAIQISSSNASADIYGTYPLDYVVPVNDVVLGETICISGVTSGISCGEVTGTNANTFDLTDVIFADYVQNAGDSGATAYGPSMPFYNKLFGIQNGVIANSAYISKAEHILSDLSLSNVVVD
jgi:hypothetical protein